MPAPVQMKTLLEAGVHFGHQTRRWDPRMRPFIFTERNGIHIIDLQQTVRRLDEAMGFKCLRRSATYIGRADRPLARHWDPQSRIRTWRPLWPHRATHLDEDSRCALRAS